MFENRKMVDMVMRVPVKVFKIESEADYDGFESYCAYEVHNNRYLPSGYIELEYLNVHHSCEHEDDSYCMKHSRDVCPHMRKIGYVRAGEMRYLYPEIGEYVIVQIDGTCYVEDEDGLKKHFE